jgi:hypothetical protein
VAHPSPPLPATDEQPETQLPLDLTTLCTGEDGHLWIGEGAERRTRLTWSPEDFAMMPGLPPMPGAMGDLEDALVFAHPTASHDGERVAVFGLLPTLDDAFDDDVRWVVTETWPEVPEADADIVGPGLMLEDGEDLIELLEGDDIAELLAGSDVVLPGDEDDDDEVEEVPAFWPGGKVYVLDRDGVQVTEAFEFDSGTPTHIEWTPDGSGLLVLHQEEDHLLLHLVDATAERDPALIAAGAPIFWSWSPDGKTMAARLVPPSGGTAGVVIGAPLDGGPLERVADAGAFYVPAWHPDGTSLLYATAGTREDELILADVRGNRLSRLLSYPGRAAFQWLGSGRHVALAVAPEGNGPFQLLELIDVGSDSSTTLWRGAFLAFLQVADGLVLCRLDGETGQLCWVHITLDGRSRPLGEPFTPARESLVALHFFEQVGPSHPWLSPDGRFLVCSGWLDDDTESDELAPPQVIVTPLDGGPARALGPGRFACFAPSRTRR